MLQRLGVLDVIAGLKPLLGNTKISKSAARRNWRELYSNSKAPSDFIRGYLDDLWSRIEWFECPRCRRSINQMADNDSCIDCFDNDQAIAKRQQQNGDYLFKAIGAYGVERYRFDGFRTNAGNAPAYQACEAFNPSTDNLYLHGPCGVGKTHLAGAILKACAVQNRQVKWVTPIYLGRGIRTRFPSDEEAFIDGVASSEVLVIDDVGVGRDSYAILQAIYEILEKRKNRRRNGLILTSNFNLHELTTKFGDDRLSSRIAGLCRVIAIKDQDNRIG